VLEDVQFVTVERTGRIWESGAGYAEASGWRQTTILLIQAHRDGEVVAFIDMDIGVSNPLWFSGALGNATRKRLATALRYLRHQARRKSAPRAATQENT
jgi:hypothetical protein